MWLKRQEVIKMTPSQTVTFVCGVVLCVIGVCTFVSGLITRARKDGNLEYKVDSALKGIDEIKDSLKGHTLWRESISIKVERHDENIETLFKKYEEISSSVNQIRDNFNQNIYQKGKQ